MSLTELPQWRTLRVMWMAVARHARLIGDEAEMRSAIHLARDCNKGMLRDKRIALIESKAKAQLDQMASYAPEREPRHGSWEDRYGREVGISAYGPI